jgi:hypothetical protein
MLICEPNLCKDETKFFSNNFQQQYNEEEALYIDEELNNLPNKIIIISNLLCSK